jgi:hypothetical protein
MDATDAWVDTAVQVGGDDDTINRLCALCAARANVDAALVRAGVEMVTVVARYTRTRFGTAAVERAKAILTFPAGSTQVGEGHSREEAIVNALELAGLL